MSVAYGKCCNESFMFRALGVVMVLWYLSAQFTQTFRALDNALSASLETLEATAVASQKKVAK